MHDHAVLHIGAAADNDRLAVGAQNGAEPDRREFAKAHIADQARVGREPVIAVGQGWNERAEGMEGHG